MNKTKKRLLITLSHFRHSAWVSIYVALRQKERHNINLENIKHMVEKYECYLIALSSYKLFLYSEQQHKQITGNYKLEEWNEK